MSDDPEVIRNRSANAARLAANALPPEMEMKLKRFIELERRSSGPESQGRTAWPTTISKMI
jgi:hypothetical protein